ncbi:hypothetical protein [Nonomuraea dietziae]|uniref:hypothetical protein n=1 Tax=Nonomuraea dietziae TaxID=65515 RepID=UPI0033F49389
MTKDWDPVTPVAVGHLLCLERRETVQKSKARRRLALKTSALGLAGTLALFVGSIAGLASPAEAQAAAVDKTMTIPFTCQSGPFAGTVDVKVTMPDTVATGATVPIKWEFVSLKPNQVLPAQTKIDIEADFDVTGAASATGTDLNWDQTVTLAAEVASGANVTVQAKTVDGKVTTGATSVTGKPVPTTSSLWLTVTPGGGTPLPETSCVAGTPNPATLTTTVGGTGGGTGEDTVSYRCTGPTTSDVQNVQIKVELTMPTTAKANEQFSIGWKGTYVTGQELKAPAAGTTISPKIFAYATLSGIAGLTSATGEGTTGTITAGQAIPLPTSAVSLKTTASTAGTATVKPGNVNFGSNSATGTDPGIKCEIQNAASVKSYTLTVAAATGSPSPSPSTSTSTSASPKPTRTVTATVTQTPVGGGKGKVTKTPKGAAETGGGGDMGPDGRMFVLTGSLVVLAAAAGGLVLRRRSVSRG